MRIPRSIALLLLLCACAEDRIRQASDAVELTPASLRFADTRVAEVAGAVIHIENNSARTRIISLEVSGPFSVDAPEVELAPWDLRELPIRFQPEAPGDLTGVLRASDSSWSAEVRLSGRAREDGRCASATGSSCVLVEFDPSLERCVQRNAANGTPCADPCLSGEALCQEGVCVGEARQCDDGSACTLDLCEPGVGCRSVDVSDQCGEGDVCSAPACDPELGCTTFPVPDGTICGWGNESHLEVCLGGRCELRPRPAPPTVHCPEASSNRLTPGQPRSHGFCTTDCWCWDAESPYGKEITEIGGRAANDVWFVSTYESELLHWNGTSLRFVPVPEPLWSLTAAAAGELFAAAYGTWPASSFYREESGVWRSVGASTFSWPRFSSDNAGHLWAFGENGPSNTGGIARWAGTHWEQIARSPTGYPTSVHVSGAHDIWWAENSGLHHWDGVSWSAAGPVEPPSEIPQRFVTGAGSEVILQTNHGLWRRQPWGWEQLSASHAGELFSQHGRIWLRTRTELRSWDANSSQWMTHAADLPHEGNVWPAEADAQSIFSAGECGRISVRRAGTWTELLGPTTQLPESVQDIATDSQGRVWAATRSGLSYFDGTAWSDLTTPFSYASRVHVFGPSDLWVLAKDPDDGYRDSVFRWNGSDWTKELGWVRELRRGHFTLWATGSQWVDEVQAWDGQTWSALPRPQCAQDRGFYELGHLGVLSDSSVWLANQHGQFAIWSGTEWTCHEGPDGAVPKWSPHPDELWAFTHDGRGWRMYRGTWSRLPFRAPASMRGLSGRKATDLYFVDGHGDVHRWNGTSLHRIDVGIRHPTIDFDHKGRPVAFSSTGCGGFTRPIR